MKKIQLYIPEDIYLEFSLMSEQENKPISVFIRDYLKKTLYQSNDAGVETLIKFSKYKLKGGKSLASNIDKIVYK